MESLIFDVDGTLWDAVALVAEGWNDGLQSMGFAPHCTEQSIRPLFGKTMTEIAQVVVPGGAGHGGHGPLHGRRDGAPAP